MRDRVARNVFSNIDLAETARIISGLAQELILLVVGIHAKDTDSIICGPAEKKVFIGIDSRTIFGGLFKGSVIDDIILLRSLDVFFLNGTRRHQCGSQSKI